MRSFGCFYWLLAAAVAALLPVTARAVPGHSMGGSAGGGSHHSMGGSVGGRSHASMGQRFGHDGRFFGNRHFANHDRFFEHHRFFDNDRDDRFFRHHRHDFVDFDFVSFGFPWWYPYPYYYGYPYDYYYSDYPAYDYQYWNNLAVSVQSELARRGYYHGAVDGVIGSRSEQAIRAFQAAQRLTATGLIDPKLLKALGISYRRA
jgi:hypothetical protein